MGLEIMKHANELFLQLSLWVIVKKLWLGSYHRVFYCYCHLAAINDKFSKLQGILTIH